MLHKQLFLKLNSFIFIFCGYFSIHLGFCDTIKAPSSLSPIQRDSHCEFSKFEELPPEIHAKIMEHLDHKSALQLGLASKACLHQFLNQTAGSTYSFFALDIFPDKEVHFFSWDSLHAESLNQETFQVSGNELEGIETDCKNNCAYFIEEDDSDEQQAICGYHFSPGKRRPFESSSTSQKLHASSPVTYYSHPDNVLYIAGYSDCARNNDRTLSIYKKFGNEAELEFIQEISAQGRIDKILLSSNRDFVYTVSKAPFVISAYKRNQESEKLTLQFSIEPKDISDIDDIALNADGNFLGTSVVSNGFFHFKMDHRNGTLENLSQFELEEDGPISIIASNTPSMFFAISNDLSHLYTLLVKDAGLVIDHQQDLELNGFDGTFSDQLITPDGRYLFVTGGSNNESGITLAFNIDQRTTHPSFQGSIEHDFSPAQIKPIQVKSRK